MVRLWMLSCEVGVLDVFGLLVRGVAWGVVVSAFCCCVLLLCGVNACVFDVSVDTCGFLVVMSCMVVWLFVCCVLCCFGWFCDFVVWFLIVLVGFLWCVLL